MELLAVKRVLLVQSVQGPTGAIRRHHQVNPTPRLFGIENISCRRKIDEMEIVDLTIVPFVRVTANIGAHVFASTDLPEKRDAVDQSSIRPHLIIPNVPLIWWCPTTIAGFSIVR